MKKRSKKRPANPLNMPHGGLIKRPGAQGKGDVIPMQFANGGVGLAQNNEYILPPDTVRKVGLGNLERLRYATHQFADGGSSFWSNPVGWFRNQAGMDDMANFRAQMEAKAMGEQPPPAMPQTPQQSTAQQPVYRDAAADKHYNSMKEWLKKTGEFTEKMADGGQPRNRLAEWFGLSSPGATRTQQIEDAVNAAQGIRPVQPPPNSMRQPPTQGGLSSQPRVGVPRYADGGQTTVTYASNPLAWLANRMRSGLLVQGLQKSSGSDQPLQLQGPATSSPPPQPVVNDSDAAMAERIRQTRKGLQEQWKNVGVPKYASGGVVGGPVWESFNPMQKGFNPLTGIEPYGPVYPADVPTPGMISTGVPTPAPRIPTTDIAGSLQGTDIIGSPYTQYGSTPSVTPDYLTGATQPVSGTPFTLYDESSYLPKQATATAPITSRIGNVPSTDPYALLGENMVQGDWSQNPPPQYGSGKVVSTDPYALLGENMVQSDLYQSPKPLSIAEASGNAPLVPETVTSAGPVAGESSFAPVNTPEAPAGSLGGIYRKGNSFTDQAMPGYEPYVPKNPIMIQKAGQDIIIGNGGNITAIPGHGGLSGNPNISPTGQNLTRANQMMAAANQMEAERLARENPGGGQSSFDVEPQGRHLQMGETVYDNASPETQLSKLYNSTDWRNGGSRLSKSAREAMIDRAKNLQAAVSQEQTQRGIDRGQNLNYSLGLGGLGMEGQRVGLEGQRVGLESVKTQAGLAEAAQKLEAEREMNRLRSVIATTADPAARDEATRRFYSISGKIGELFPQQTTVAGKDENNQTVFYSAPRFDILTKESVGNAVPSAAGGVANLDAQVKAYRAQHREALDKFTDEQLRAMILKMQQQQASP